jgi:O-antigen/teichoic acid export membrane protein
MSTVQRIAKNTTVLLVGQVASYLLAFFSMMYVARCLGAAGFGILSFALASIWSARIGYAIPHRKLRAL